MFLRLFPYQNGDGLAVIGPGLSLAGVVEKYKKHLDANSPAQ